MKQFERITFTNSRIELLLEQNRITNGSVIEYALAHKDEDQFVKVFDPVVEVVHSDVSPEHYGPMGMAIVSAIVGKPNFPFISTIDINKNGTHVRDTYGGSGDGWVGYYDIFATKDVWVSEDGDVGSLPVAWMAQRSVSGEPHRTDKYVLPLKSVLNNMSVYQEIYQLCQQWIDAADMRKFTYPTRKEK
ncbi:hypothetical protein KBD75_01980 [Candidatus Woesebacteria bacterium]|nr:hypothetical protein [Candidatus Woesebacteria bacterium]